jgi:sugar (pentulose or hexulose) kinase
MDLLIGFDIGTSTIKGVLAACNDDLLVQASRPTELERPRDDWVEFSAERCYELVCEVCRELLASAPSGGTIVAIALSGASGNTLLLDKDLRPLGRAINWMDRRAADTWQQLLPGLDPDDVYQRVGWPFGGMFPLAHLAGLRRHDPEQVGAAAHCVMNTTYLYSRLCGLLVCDHSTATTFYLQDQVAGQWHQPYLELLGIEAASMPRLAASGSLVGTISAAAAAETGLGQQTRVVLGSFDHPSAARGVGVFDTGKLLLSCGTSWVGFYPIADRAAALGQRMLVDPFLRPDGPWAGLFSLTGVGEMLDALLDRLVFAGGSRDFELLDDVAGGAEPGSGGLVLDPMRRETLDDETLEQSAAEHTLEERGRAVMEGAAYEMRRRIEKLSAAGIRAETLTMVGGPSESTTWTQIMADVTGVPVALANGQVAGALGAAILAGSGAGIFTDDREGFEQLGGETRQAEPDDRRSRLYADLYQRYVSAHQ